MQSTKCDVLIFSLLFISKFLKRLVLFGNEPCNVYFKRLYPCRTCPFFGFSDLTYIQKTQKKALGAIVLVDKNNEPRSGRLLSTICMEIVCSINSNYIWKCLLFGINSEKVNIMKSLFFYLPVVVCITMKNRYSWIITLRKYQYWYIWTLKSMYSLILTLWKYQYCFKWTLKSM